MREEEKATFSKCGNEYFILGRLSYQEKMFTQMGFQSG